MCRSIKKLRGAESPVTPEEISAASLQFIRKVSGYNKPSKRNEEQFNRAVREVAKSVTRLLQDLPPNQPA